MMKAAFSLAKLFSYRQNMTEQFNFGYAKAHSANVVTSALSAEGRKKIYEMII